MTTLYIRDISDEVAETLKARAAEEGTSLSAYVGAELTKIARRPTNTQLVAALRRLDRSDGPSTADILDAIRSSRR